MTSYSINNFPETDFENTKQKKSYSMALAR